jgi:hypothetical protein
VPVTAIIIIIVVATVTTITTTLALARCRDATKAPPLIAAACGQNNAKLCLGHAHAATACGTYTRGFEYGDAAQCAARGFAFNGWSSLKL